ncbi:uncharacterized protein I303_107281 [Kwoniella dejecticola CBS 10117]|uniref:Major facilitator superfamily (MFS) profile domain-containing protein n=1 Tax=Kwoniella dejecticola CBS 10117 TaxID=1296121 RepID=A0A1A5ZZB5_9TREE|nr:uncharacterized protein I303_06684 [Kwoniella dejecticola CBS 10117]OBR83125.1 hypothetical protein I303_06684 [Kwoniella dejecticola CBS 10117]
MAELQDIERVSSRKSQNDFVDVTVADSGEYAEYQALCDHFQGAALKRLHRKTDWRVLPPLFVIYMMTYVDRTNVGNAKLFGAQTDLKMDGTDWNIGLSLLFVTYALVGPFTNIFVKKYSARRVLPLVFFGCGATIIGAGCSANRAQWFILRLLLGVFEAAVYPGCVYFMTTWYSAEVITSRCSYFYLGATCSGAVSGLLAYGIGQLDGHWGFRGWRWIYVLEGFISCILAFITIFWLQSDPQKPHKWLTEQEQRFIVLRNKYSYGKDKSGSNSEFTLKAYTAAFASPHVWVLGFAWFCYAAAIYGYSFTLPTIINNMGFTAVKAQELSTPPYFAAFFTVLILGIYSDRLKSRALTIIVLSFISFVGLVICYATAGHKHLVALTYVGCMIAAIGFYPLTPMFTAWFSVQVAGPTKRAAALSCSNFFTQIGGIVGSNIYLAKQAPRYQAGFGTSFGLVLVGDIVIIAAYWWWIGRVNAKRAAMSEDEIRAKYSPEQLQEMGDKSPFFVYQR